MDRTPGPHRCRRLVSRIRFRERSGDAVATPDIAGHRKIWSFTRQHLDAVDFRGKSVLDVGAWDGYWSFYAEKRGAERVLATDDRTQNWSDGNGIHLAKELFQSNSSISPSIRQPLA